MFPRLIALCGVARSGKDTFYQTLARVRPGAIRISIGDIIRHDCQKFILDTTGINVNHCSDTEKEIIRPILVGYGITKRKQTQGKYFREKLEDMMAVISSGSEFNPDVNYFVMTDVRFAEYDYDEPDWVRDNKGLLIHVSRIMGWKPHPLYESYSPDPVYLKAPNDVEAENDPKLRAAADYRVEWENRNDIAMFEEHVNQFLSFVKEVWK